VKGLLALGWFLIAAPAVAFAASRPVDKKTYIQRVQKEIDGLVIRLRKIEAQSSALDAEQRQRLKKALAALWQKERAVRIQLESMKRASGDRWNSLRRKEDADLIRLRKSYQFVVNHYPVQK
jgi:hypothetical protein